MTDRKTIKTTTDVTPKRLAAFFLAVQPFLPTEAITCLALLGYENGSGILTFALTQAVATILKEIDAELHTTPTDGVGARMIECIPKEPSL